MEPLAGKRAAALPGPRRYRSTAGRSLLIRFFDLLIAWQERVSERHRLRELDDHMLRDIGLSRADVEQEASRPFWKV